MEPLDGARLKVVRAQEHLNSLNAEIRRYLDEQPHEVWSQPKGNLNAIPPLIISAPPLRLSTIIGDCVTNARAALDYIAWQLVLRHSLRTLTTKEEKGIHFPINGSIKCANSLTKLTDLNVPTKAIDRIKSVQPDHAGYEPLRFLEQLVNFDKHRMLLLTIGEFDSLTVTLATPPLYADLIGAAMFTVPRHLVTEGRPALQSDVQMKGQTTVFVTWQDVTMPREPVDRTLEQIVECVANIVPSFETDC